MATDSSDPNRYQSLRRLRSLDKLLYQRRMNVSDMASLLGVHTRTIHRDLEALSDSGAHVRNDGPEWWSERVCFVVNLGSESDV